MKNILKAIFFAVLSFKVFADEEAVKSKVKIINSGAIKELANQVKGFVYWKDTKGRYLGCNKSYLGGFQTPEGPQVTEADVINKTDNDFKNFRTADEYQKDVAEDQKVIKTGHSLVATSSIRTSEGSRYINVVKMPLKNAKKQVVGVLVIQMSAPH